MEDIIKGTEVTKSFGGVFAVKNVDFTVHRGEIMGLIGPNGAGKTTLLNCIGGVFPLDRGTIWFDGCEISSLKPNQVTRLGISRTFQVVRPFMGMTVRENVAIGALFGSRRAVPLMGSVWEEVDEILEFIGLKDKCYAKVDVLTLADRKRLEVARALAMRPVVLLLDEVMAGLNQREMETVLELVRRINAKGITVIMIEHIMKAIVSVCQRVMVMHHGELITVGLPLEVLSDQKVIEAYLGKEWAKFHEYQPARP